MPNNHHREDAPDEAVAAVVEVQAEQPNPVIEPVAPPEPPPSEPAPLPAPPPEPPVVPEISAEAALAAFEQEHFPNSPRLDGEIESGHGSMLMRAPEKIQARHAALKRWVKAEFAMNEAATALKLAQDKHDEALLDVLRCRTPTE